MKKNIVLFGFMGTGKSVIADILSERLGLNIIEMDQIIVEEQGMPITRIFEEKGEKYFRQQERDLVMRLAGSKDQVISTGGGVVLNRDNIRLFMKNGLCVCLNASADEIYNRTKNDNGRPLLNVADPLSKIRNMLEFRKPFYDQVPVQVNTDGKSPHEVAFLIENMFLEKKFIKDSI